MTTVTLAPKIVIGGVDTHADIHVAAACDELGKVLGTKAFPTTASGYRALLSFLTDFGEVQAVGVEGTGSYGSGLSRHRAEEQVRVFEVSRPNRQVRHAHGKSDVIDAIAAARAVISDQATATPKSHDGVVEGLRVLQIVHRSAHKARTQTLNQLHALIVTAPDPIRGQLRGLGRPQMLTICRGYRPGDRDDVASVTNLALRELATRVADLDEQIKRVESRRHRLVRAQAPRLLAVFGVDPDTAATLLVAAGDNPDRLHSEASYAALLGASPIRASSGKTKRKRLNRGGDRQGNSALWHIVITRMSTQPATQDYVERRTTEGLSTAKSSAASSATSPAESSTHYPKNSELDRRSITSRAPAAARCRQGYASRLGRRRVGTRSMREWPITRRGRRWAWFVPASERRGQQHVSECRC